MQIPFARRLFATVVGAIALAGSVSAQDRTAAPPLAQLPGQVMLSQAPAAAAATPVAPAKGATVVQGNAGCSSCGQQTTGSGSRMAAVKGYAMEITGGYIGTSCNYGHNCNNGNGSFRSDVGFFIGNSTSFFGPCGPTPFSWHLTGNGGNLGKCHTPIQGRGPSGPFVPCNYDSYLNH